MEETILDLFKLQKPGERYNKAWILAKGKKLRTKISYILKDIDDIDSKDQIINELASRLNIKCLFF